MAKLKLNLKEIDFKRLMLEKGERFALWAMVGVMALLIIFGVFVNGFSRGSASANSAEINDLCTRTTSSLQTSAPDDKIKALDPEYTRAAALPAIDPLAVLCAHALFTTQDTVDKKWRKPEVLTPDEFQVTLLRGLLRSYVPAKLDGKEAIIFLKSKGKDKDKMGVPGGMMGKRPPSPNMGGMARIWNMGGGAGGGPGMFPGMMPNGFQKGNMPNMMQNPTGEDSKEIESYRVAIDKASEEKEGRPAEAVFPVRMAIVNAAFPYRRQYETFKSALKMPSIEAMENEATVEFLGVHVQRREIGPDGKPSSNWRDLDLIGPLRPFLAFGIEPEDPTYKAFGLVWAKDRLLTPRPFLGRNQQYPAVELPGIDRTLKAIDDARQANAPPPTIKHKDKFAKDYDFIGDSEDVKTGPGGFPGERPMPAPMPKGKDKAVVPGIPGGAANAFGSQERLIPEKCLLRFVDVQIEPGKTYEYQVQVKMGNPLHGKTDQAISKKLTEGKEIVGEWTLVNKRLQVPFEGDYYFYEDPQKSRMVAYNPDRVWTQIHRWFDWVPVNPATPRESLTAIGDWGIADQSAVVRGEYIGRWEEVELPVWNTKQEEFVLAQHPDTYRKKGMGVRVVHHKGVPVDFNTGSLLVDFDGGKADLFYRDKDKKEQKVRDESAIEALVLTPEGKLIVRDSRIDADNKERTERVKEVADWTKSVREKINNKPGGTGGKDDIFGDKKPKQP
jgi:hypothetical protein